MKLSQEQVTMIGVAISAIVALFAIRYYAGNSGSNLGTTYTAYPSSIGGNGVGYSLNQGAAYSGPGGQNLLTGNPGSDLASILASLQGLTAPASTSTATPTSGTTTPSTGSTSTSSSGSTSSSSSGSTSTASGGSTTPSSPSIGQTVSTPGVGLQPSNPYPYLKEISSGSYGPGGR